MSPPKKKATSTRHARAKRAARRSRSAKTRRASTRPAAASRPSPRAAKRAAAGRAARKAARLTPRRDAAGAKARPEGGTSGRQSGAMKQDASRPRLTVVARPAPPKPTRPVRKRRPAEVTEFAGAKSGAAPKDLALFGLERSRVAVHAALQGLGAGSADRPIAPGKWTPRQMVLHLAYWDREIAHKYLEPAAGGHRADIRRTMLDAMNDAGLQTLEHHDWESAKRLLQTTYEDLWDAFDSIPADPAEVWSPEHAVGELVREVTDHDRHHADIIKRWRAEIGA